MRVFEFSIIASGLDPRADDFEARFYEAGCDDATVSFQKGHTILDFAREAASVDAAISTAVSDATKAGASVDRIERRDASRRPSPICTTPIRDRLSGSFPKP